MSQWNELLLNKIEQKIEGELALAKSWLIQRRMEIMIGLNNRKGDREQLSLCHIHMDWRQFINECVFEMLAYLFVTCMQYLIQHKWCSSDTIIFMHWACNLFVKKYMKLRS